MVLTAQHLSNWPRSWEVRVGVWRQVERKGEREGTKEGERQTDRQRQERSHGEENDRKRRGWMEGAR